MFKRTICLLCLLAVSLTARAQSVHCWKDIYPDITFLGIPIKIEDVSPEGKAGLAYETTFKVLCSLKGNLPSEITIIHDPVVSPSHDSFNFDEPTLVSATRDTRYSPYETGRCHGNSFGENALVKAESLSVCKNPSSDWIAQALAKKRYGKEKLPELIKLIESDKRLSILNGLYGLRTLGATAAPAASIILKNLSKYSYFASSLALSDINSDGAIIQKLQDNNDPITEVESATLGCALGKSSSSNVDEITKLFENPDNRITRTALIALVRKGEKAKQAIPAIIKNMEKYFAFKAKYLPADKISDAHKYGPERRGPGLRELEIVTNENCIFYSGHYLYRDTPRPDDFYLSSYALTRMGRKAMSAMHNLLHSNSVQMANFAEFTIALKKESSGVKRTRKLNSIIGAPKKLFLWVFNSDYWWLLLIPVLIAIFIGFLIIIVLSMRIIWKVASLLFSKK